MMRMAAVLGCLLVLLPVAASRADDSDPRPFDGNHNAMPVVEAALAEARESDRRLLLVLGANWCHDSRALARHFQDAELAALLEARFTTRFIDVGRRESNQDVSARFGVPAVYATPTVLVIDPDSETLLNRQERSDWGSAASRPVGEARAWFARWAEAGPPGIGLVESSLVYQAMQIEIEIFEEEEATRLAAAYRDIARWRDLPAADRPADLAEREREVEQWRRSLPRQVEDLRSQAHSLISGALTEIAGDGPITPETVATLDARDPDIALDFSRHDSTTW